MGVWVFAALDQSLKCNDCNRFLRILADFASCQSHPWVQYNNISNHTCSSHTYIKVLVHNYPNSSMKIYSCPHQQILWWGIRLFITVTIQIVTMYHITLVIQIITMYHITLVIQIITVYHITLVKEVRNDGQLRLSWTWLFEFSWRVPCKNSRPLELCTPTTSVFFSHFLDRTVVLKGLTHLVETQQKVCWFFRTLHGPF